MYQIAEWFIKSKPVADMYFCIPTCYPLYIGVHSEREKMEKKIFVQQVILEGALCNLPY